jgi:hypothetical protein
MSSGPNKKPPAETTFITMDSEEFNKVCKRLNQMLTARVQKAWDKKQRKPTQKSSDNHIEASKEAFAFIHLMDLVEHMSSEIHDLRLEVAAIGAMDDDDFEFSPMDEPQRKKYLN